MKKGLYLALIVTLVMCSIGLLNAQTITQNTTGTTSDGWFYSFWNQGGGGSVSMTLGAGGNYSSSWNNCTNFTCGKGWKTGSANKVINFSGSFNGGSNGYLAAYGWTRNKLVEYYVVENYGNWTPPGGNSIGTLTSDGGTYNIYKMYRTNAPSIESNSSNFDQYWSVRTTKRSSGTVTMANHFAAWKAKGMDMGSTWDYLIMETEGYQSSGSSNITVSDTPTTVTPTPTATPTPTPTVVITPTPQQNPVFKGGPYSLNGTSDSVDLPDGLTNNLGDFSVACWVNWTTATNWVRIFDFGGDSNIFMMLTPQSGTTGFPYFAITLTGNNGEQGLNGTSALPTGTWQHLAVVKSGNTGTLYINKVEVAKNTSMTLRPADLGNTTNNYIGKSQWTNDPLLAASVDKFVFYNRAISASEVTALGNDVPGTTTGKAGDVNGDGSVTIVDAMLIAQASAGQNPQNYNAAKADVNCDNTVNVNDALLVARYAAGLSSVVLGCN